MGPGEPTGTITPSVSAQYVQISERAAEGGFQKLASDYQVRVTRFELTTPDWVLVGGAAGTPRGFDPANPPPGYSLCHGGHCHRDDGALIPYDEVASADTPGGPSPLLAFDVGRLDLLSGTALEEVSCEPGCTLGETNLSRVRIPVTHLAIEGVVRDARTSARIPERPFRALLPLVGADPIDAARMGAPPGGPLVQIESDLDVPVNREHLPRVELGLRLEPSAALFDRIDWAQARLTPEGVIALESEANSDARTALLEGLVRSTVASDVERRAP